MYSLSDQTYDKLDKPEIRNRRQLKRLCWNDFYGSHYCPQITALPLKVPNLHLLHQEPLLNLVKVSFYTDIKQP